MQLEYLFSPSFLYLFNENESLASPSLLVDKLIIKRMTLESSKHTHGDKNKAEVSKTYSIKLK